MVQGHGRWSFVGSISDVQLRAVMVSSHDPVGVFEENI